MAVELFAWDPSIVPDPTVAAKMKALAGGKAVAPGPEGGKLFNQAVSDLKLDFNSADGTPASKFAGKSLDPDAGGRSIFLKAKIMANGESAENAQKIVTAHAAKVQAAKAASGDDSVMAKAKSAAQGTAPAKAATTQPAGNSVTAKAAAAKPM
jgi:hypothetical protein